MQNIHQMQMMAAQAALKHITNKVILAVGTGTIVECFIELLATVREQIKATVASSKKTEQLLLAKGLPVIAFNSIEEITLYIDSADAYNNIKQLVKGDGGALTREKILANASKKFICLVDQTKAADILGKFPIPVEVIPMARSYVAREIVKLGGLPQLRNNFITDNGNIILDVHNLKIECPIKLEIQLNNIPGAVENGLFAARGADQIIVGLQDSVISLD